MKVYPWRQKDNQGNRKMVMKAITSTSRVFRIIGGVLSLGVASVVGMFLVHRFSKRNDSWAKRGWMMTLIGAVIFLALGGPVGWFNALNEAMLSLGDKATTGPILPMIGFLIRTIAFGAIFQGVAVVMASYVYEVTGDRFLARIVPTWAMKRRRKKNEARLVQNDKPDPDSMAFGVIVDDPIPWRTGRYGMIVARPFESMGHGVVVGGNGTGKTVLGIGMGYQAASAGAAVLFIDFKASIRTMEALKQAAAKAGRKFYSFDLGTGSSETSWYDPLDWNGTPSEKASMIVNSLQFTEDGAAAYYRGQATDWLILQFEVMNAIGLYPGESSFDFLLETSVPTKLMDRLRVLKGGTPQQRELFASLQERAAMGNLKDLAGLRQNLSIIVNAGGDRLRPQQSAPAILMSRAVEEGAVVYFGLSPATDQVALKTIGSLILRNLGVLAGERMRDPNVANLRPVLTLVDEASRLQDRAIVMDNLLATSREGGIYLWMLTQSFSTWPESTVVEMNTNVQTHVAFRVQDRATAEHLVSTLEDIPVLEEMEEGKITHRAFQGDVKERSGDSRTTLTTAHFMVDAPMGLADIENLHAYVWFTGSWTRATLEEWESKRLKKPDTIRNDVPLVHIYFPDYTTEAEPIKGSTFEELVTSADDLTLQMAHTTIKRTRRTSFTGDEDVQSPFIHLPGSGQAAPQWESAPSDQGQFAPEGYGYGMGGRMTDREEPVWDESDGPRWDDAPMPETYGGAQTASAGGVSWEDDSDAPPVSHFYKGAGAAGVPVVDASDFADDGVEREPSVSPVSPVASVSAVPSAPVWADDEEDTAPSVRHGGEVPPVMPRMPAEGSGVASGSAPVWGDEWAEDAPTGVRGAGTPAGAGMSVGGGYTGGPVEDAGVRESPVASGASDEGGPVPPVKESAVDRSSAPKKGRGKKNASEDWM